MAEVKLIAYEREFKFVEVCTCGKRWNFGEQCVRKATANDVDVWARQHGYELVDPKYQVVEKNEE